MKRTCLTICITLLMLSHLSLHATDPKEEIEKKMEKIAKLKSKAKYDDADKALKELLEKYPAYSDGWDQLAAIRDEIYRASPKMSMMGNMKITVEGKDKSGINNDSLAQSLAAMLHDLNPSAQAYKKLMLACRMGTAFSLYAEVCAVYLRTEYVDGPTDTAVKKDAAKWFNKAEAEFQAKNYNKAADYYKQAIEIDPGMYKARLYLGDVYYMTKRYSEAIMTFKSAAIARPDLIEPLKYLSDAYFNQGVYDRAYRVAAEAVILYPDMAMRGKLELAADKDKHPMSLHMLARGVLPNKMGDAMMSEEEQKAHVAREGSCWQYYLDAKKQIASHCDDTGVISGAGDMTKQHYLEVYSWEYMLSKSPDKSLDFARRMQDKGYLDCYVMVSCFHQDFYGQYRHFADLNKQRIKDYFDLLAKEEKENK